MTTASGAGVTPRAHGSLSEQSGSRRDAHHHHTGTIVITARRAQRFHELVEDHSTGGARLPEHADLLDVVGALRAVPEPVADPAFVAPCASGCSPRPSRCSRPPQPSARTPTSVCACVRPRRMPGDATGASRPWSAASRWSASRRPWPWPARAPCPGDHLYSVKRGLESAHAQLTFDRADRGRVLLDNAGTRLDEAEQLSREHGDPARVSQALDAFTQEAIDGSDLLVADYQSTGDRSSITDAAHLHRDEHGAAEAAAVGGAAAVLRLAAPGGTGARPGAADLGPQLPDLRRAADRLDPERAGPGDRGDGRHLAGRHPEAAPRAVAVRLQRRPVAARRVRSPPPAGQRHRPRLDRRAATALGRTTCSTPSST